MPNKNYLRGRRLEYDVVKTLRYGNPNGFAQRMAGSHSPFDVIAFNPDTREITFVQCKTKLSDKVHNDVDSEINITNEIWLKTFRRTRFIKRKSK